MARDPKYDILFEEVAIGPKTMRNRFFQAAHCSGAGSEKPGFQASLRGMKAEGGWAAISTEYCSVSPESDDFHRIGARLWDEGDVRNLAVMVDAVHEHGSLAAVELVHGSVDSPAHETRIPARGVTSTQSMYELLRTPRPMTKDDIRAAQRDLVNGAIRAERAGFDILTLYVAMAQGFAHHFLLPLFNNRTDEYGGSFENRARFSREVLEMMREATGDRCAISVRFGLDTLPAPEGLGDQGIRAEGEGHEFIEFCDHLVDMWDIQLSWAGAWGEDAAPSRTHGQNHAKRYLDQVKKHTNKPVMNVGRFTDPDVMVEAIRSGQCDIIGAARPSIADPFLPSKIDEGRIDDIRECIGCNACVARWSIGGPAIICTQNPTMGEEYRRGWHPEKFDRAKNSDNLVLVVGAGPAGLECAMVLGKRGMSAVHLVDAAPDVGGSMRWMTQLPGLGEWNRLVDYRRTQIEKLDNVEIVLGTTLGPGDVLEYGADIVVAATGAMWARDGLNGFTQSPIPGADASESHVLTPEQVMAGKPVGERVVIVDTDGHFVAVGMAERLLRLGKNVTLVTPFNTMAPQTILTLEAPRLNRDLRSLGMEILVECSLVEIRRGSVLVKGAWDDDSRTLEADSVVLVTQRLRNDALSRDLRADPKALGAAGIKALYEIGDCYAPQSLADTIFHAHRLAREIDAPNPAVPLPFIRERRLVGAAADDYRLDSSAIGDVV